MAWLNDYHYKDGKLKNSFSYNIVSCIYIFNKGSYLSDNVEFVSSKTLWFVLLSVYDEAKDDGQYWQTHGM